MFRGLRRVFLLAIVIGFVTLPTPGRTADCKPLTRVVTLDTTDLRDGRVTVPVQIGGTQVPMLVDTGAPATTIDDELSKKLHLGRYRLFEGAFRNSSGQSFQYTAVVQDMMIGGARLRQGQVLVEPSPLSTDGSILGSLGMDIMLHYDVDLDLAGHKFNLMLPDHCPGVVYWPASAVADVPLRTTRSGHVVVSVTLDGKPIDAILDTGASDTLLTDTAAQNLFGLAPTSPDMTRVAESGSGRAYYVHTFKSLDLNGIAFADVPIVIYEDVMAERMKQQAETGSRLSSANIENGLAQLTLGMNELRKLHLYLAFKEGRMYATLLVASATSATKN